MGEVTSEQLQCGDLCLDPAQRTVARDGERLDLQGLTFDLLAYFVQHPDEVLHTDAIIAAVWPDQDVSNDVLTQRVRLLRRALRERAERPRYLQTVRGVGYRWLIRPEEAQSSQGAPAASPQQTPLPTAAATHSGSWLGIGSAIAGLLLCAIGGWMWFERNAASSDSAGSTDPYAELLARAGFYAGLGQPDDAMRAQTLYEQILAEEPTHRPARLGLSFLLSQRACQHGADMELARRAHGLAQELLTAAPTNAATPQAQVHAARAYALDCLGKLPQALAGYREAYALDPTNVASLASAANLLQVSGKLAAALQANFEALKLGSYEPRFSSIQIARVLELLGYDSAAQERYARAVTLQPHDAFAALAYVRFLYTHDQAAAARAAAIEAQRLGAGSSELWLVRAALAEQRPAEQRQHLLAAAQASAPEPLIETLSALQGGEPPRSEWLAARQAAVIRSIDDGDVWPDNYLHLALLHWHAGSEAESFAALQAAVDAGFLDAAWLARVPWFRPLRERAEFGALMREIQAIVAHERSTAVAADWWRPEWVTATPPAE